MADAVPSIKQPVSSKAKYIFTTMLITVALLWSQISINRQLDALRDQTFLKLNQIDVQIQCNQFKSEALFHRIDQKQFFMNEAVRDIKEHKPTNKNVA